MGDTKRVPAALGGFHRPPSRPPTMKRLRPALLLPLTLLLAACGTFTPQIGMKEKKWLRNTTAYDIVYIEGNVKAYRAGGSYYYFKDGGLVKVTPSLLPADKL